MFLQQTTRWKKAIYFINFVLKVWGCAPFPVSYIRGLLLLLLHNFVIWAAVWRSWGTFPPLLNINDSCILGENDFLNGWLNKIFQIYPGTSLHLGIFVKQKTHRFPYMYRQTIQKTKGSYNHFPGFSQDVTPWSSPQCLSRLRNGAKNHQCSSVQPITITVTQYLHAKLSKRTEIHCVTHSARSKDGYWPWRTHNIKAKLKQQLQKPQCTFLLPSLPAHHVPPFPARPLQSCCSPQHPRPLALSQKKPIHFPRYNQTKSFPPLTGWTCSSIKRWFE